MFRRLPYYLVVVAALAYVALKWKTVPYDLQLIEVGSAKGYLSLGYFILVLIAPVVAVSVMRRDQPSTSLRGRLHILRTTTSVAFARSPMRTSVRLLLGFSLCAIVPLGLSVLAHPRGFGTLAPRDWALLGVMECPVVLIAMVVIGGIRRGGR